MLVPFFKFFLAQKFTFFCAFFYETIMLSFLSYLLHKLNCYFYFYFAQESKKFPEDGQESMSENEHGETFLGKNARC
jgi:hypothetical protein